MANLLIVEDNEDYQELLVNFLESAGHVITAADDGEQAVKLSEKTKFDLILLDLMLPKMDGYSVCRKIRTKQDVPVIMLTALDSEAHQIKGYDLNIDDYITKPVSMPLLVQKVNAVLRRTAHTSGGTLSYKNIVINTDEHIVYVSGTAAEFTLREYEILCELMKNPGMVVTRKELIDRLWKYNFYGDTRIVDTHIKNIRRKLAESDPIETVRGVGYKLAKEKI